MANSNINIRIDSEVKAEAQALFSKLGMDLSTAVNIFIRQAIDFGGIPFTPAKRYSSFDEFLKELDEETDDEC